jgi:hypothetical protein
MRHFVLVLPAAAVALSGLACGTSGGNFDAVATGVSATLTSVAAAVPTETASPESTPTPAPLPPTLWKPYSSSDSTAWWLENGSATQVTLPVDVGQYYDYSPANGAVLYASHFSTVGAGPANLAVSDLWMVDYPSGKPTVLIPDDTVVEALWAPDGAGFVYIGATPTTYELRYRSLAGDERVLAGNVAPTWGVAPSGTTVAFTRETGYAVPGAPGLFLVPMAGGPEVMISTADRQGAGALEDKPSWSPDESYVALPKYGNPPASLVIAAADGSLDSTLTFVPEIASDPVLGSTPTAVLWYPDGRHLVGPSGYAEGMGGPWALVRYDLGDDGHTVVSAERVGTGFGVIAWNVPGQSMYFQDENAQIGLMTLP